MSIPLTVLILSHTPTAYTTRPPLGGRLETVNAFFASRLDANDAGYAEWFARSRDKRHGTRLLIAAEIIGAS